MTGTDPILNHMAEVRYFTPEREYLSVEVRWSSSYGIFAVEMERRSEMRMT